VTIKVLVEYKVLQFKTKVQIRKCNLNLMH